MYIYIKNVVITKPNQNKTKRELKWIGSQSGEREKQSCHHQGDGWWISVLVSHTRGVNLMRRVSLFLFYFLFFFTLFCVYTFSLFADGKKSKQSARRKFNQIKKSRAHVHQVYIVNTLTDDDLSWWFSLPKNLTLSLPPTTDEGDFPLFSTTFHFKKNSTYGEGCGYTLKTFRLLLFE